MIRDRKKWDDFERELVRREPPDLKKNIRIAGAMYEEARRLGVFPPADPLEGIDVDIHIARVVNSVPSAPRQNRR